MTFPLRMLSINWDQKTKVYWWRDWDNHSESFGWSLYLQITKGHEVINNIHSHFLVGMWVFYFLLWGDTYRCLTYLFSLMLCEYRDFCVPNICPLTLDKETTWKSWYAWEFKLLPMAVTMSSEVHQPDQVGLQVTDTEQTLQISLLRDCKLDP